MFYQELSHSRDQRREKMEAENSDNGKDSDTVFKSDEK
jgi:hypothetical protein